VEISFRPVGVVRVKATEDQVREQEGEIEGELEIFPEFEPALEGLEGYSHLFLIFYFHKLRPEQIGPLQVRPKRLVQRGFKLEELPLLGIFALDSPSRPNPIGLTLVRLLKREGRRLLVKGLDAFDGTPILDLKGYRPDYRTDDYFIPDWHRRLMNEKGRV
jgi:tRNA-Thr(GGU) m(6)t(6)A37 methyltransferase TsaA